MLPNSPNVIMAAERAAELSEKQVVVVPSRSQQTALAALVALSRRRARRRRTPRRSATALARVRSGSVAPAARDDADGRFSVGEAVGFVGESLVAWGDPEATLAAGAGERSATAAS